MGAFFRYSAFFIALLFFTACGKDKKVLLAKKWTVTEMDLSGTRVSGDLVHIIYAFNPDGSFYRTEDGKKEEGMWSVNNEGDKITLEFKQDNLKIEKAIEQLSEDKLIISGEEYSMKRTLTMEPVKDSTAKASEEQH